MSETINISITTPPMPEQVALERALEAYFKAVLAPYTGTKLTPFVFSEIRDVLDTACQRVVQSVEDLQYGVKRQVNAQYLTSRPFRGRFSYGQGR